MSGQGANRTKWVVLERGQGAAIPENGRVKWVVCSQALGVNASDKLNRLSTPESQRRYRRN
jgi:hypothetical protein